MPALGQLMQLEQVTDTRDVAKDRAGEVRDDHGRAT
jgi:hypothetical protein